MANNAIPQAEDYSALRSALIKLAIRRYGFPVIEAEEIADEVGIKFLKACAVGSVDSRTSYPYVRAIAVNECIDRLRRSRVEMHGIGPEVVAEDDIARLLDARVGAKEVEDALRVAARAGDAQCTKVINEWLRLAERESRTPSARDVAIRVGLSHPTVLKAMKRFRNYVENLR